MYPLTIECHSAMIVFLHENQCCVQSSEQYQKPHSTLSQMESYCKAQLSCNRNVLGNDFQLINHEDIIIIVLLDNRQPYKHKVFQGYMQKLGLGGGGEIKNF